MFAGVIPRRDISVATLNSSGAGTGRIQNNNAAVLWVLFQVSVVSSPNQSSGNCQCRLTPPTGVIDTSYFAGTGDTAPGVYFLYPMDFIDHTWSGGPASGRGIVTYQYLEVPL